MTVNRDELQAARTELAAQLATIEAKVEPFKDDCASITLSQCIAVGLLAASTQCSNAHSMAAFQQRQAGPLETCSPQGAADTKDSTEALQAAGHCDSGCTVAW